MLRRLSATFLPVAYLALLAGGVSCDATTEPAPDLGTDYYPLEVGTYRVYNVEDVLWTENKSTKTTSQRRERITEAYTDATGQPAYKVVRSWRSSGTGAWQDDSVQTITLQERALMLTRNNLRTVELAFPVRAESAWNFNAFNSASAGSDTIYLPNRHYMALGAPYTAGAKSYEETVTVVDGRPGTEHYDDNVISFLDRRQVYAKGVGPVFRERQRYYYCQDPNKCSVGTNYIVQGAEHRETLVEQGKL